MDNIYDEFNALVSAMQYKYPKLGISGGYIGNCCMGAYLTRERDDRSWYIFTQVPNPKYSGRYNFGGYATDKLPELVAKIKAGEFDKWVAQYCLPVLDSYNQ